MNQSALEGFVKIVEMDSFSAAAEALYLSQSALSQQIRTLEGQLQFELFQHVRPILTQQPPVRVTQNLVVPQSGKVHLVGQEGHGTGLRVIGKEAPRCFPAILALR